MIKKSKKFICSLLLCAIATSTSTGLATAAYTLESDNTIYKQEYLIGNDVITVEKFVENDKNIIKLSDKINENILICDETGNNVIGIIQNDVYMTKEEFINKNAVIETTTYIDHTAPMIIEERAASWVYAYTAKSTLSGKIDSAINIAALLVMAFDCGAISSFIGLANGIIGGYGASIGSLFQTSYISTVYQDRNDRHSWKKNIDQYLNSNWTRYDRSTTVYFSTYTPI